MKSPIFQRYGGFASISKIVMSFYDKVLDSPLTSPYFVTTDMKQQIDHQTKFMASLMGGPASYTDEQLERIHSHLGITEPAFMEIVYLLSETLEDFDFADDDIRYVENEMMNRKNYIVTRR